MIARCIKWCEVHKVVQASRLGFSRRLHPMPMRLGMAIISNSHYAIGVTRSERISKVIV